MRNFARKQARSVTIGYMVQVAGEWVAVIGTRHDFSYNNPSRRKTVAEVTLKLEGGNALRLAGNQQVAVSW